MCQLFGLSANVPVAATFSWAGFSQRGGATGDHVDGFGLAFHDGPDCRVFTDTAPASESALAEWLRIHPIAARTVIAHVRKATQGPVRAANTHPFVREWQGRTWSFAHQGDLKAFNPRWGRTFRPVGGTDSERAFCWMLQALRSRFRARREPAWQHLAPAVAALAGQLSRHGTFNFLMSDGEALYAHASTSLFLLERQHPFATAQLVDRDLSLDLAEVRAPGDRMTLLASAPLTHGEPWQALSPGETRVIVGGETMWRHLDPDVRRAPAGPAPARRSDEVVASLG